MKIPISKTRLKIAILESHSDLPGANELKVGHQDNNSSDVNEPLGWHALFLYCGRNKVGGLLQTTFSFHSRHFQPNFLQWNLLQFNQNVIEVYCYQSNLQSIVTGLGNCVAPYRWQAFVWKNNYQVKFIVVIRTEWVKVSVPHYDVIKWKHFPRYWPFVREIHRSPVNFPHKGQWRGALMFTLICARMNDWVNNREAGDLRRYLAHYDVIVMICVRDPNVILPLPVDGLAPIGAGPSAVTVLTEKSNIFSWKFVSLSMILSFKMDDETPQNLAALPGSLLLTRINLNPTKD